MNVNRWLYWAAQLRGPAGRRFRDQHQEDFLPWPTRYRPNCAACVATSPPNYRFSSLRTIAGPRASACDAGRDFALTTTNVHSALDNQLGYLVAQRPAPDAAIFVDVVAEAWNERHDHPQIVEFIQWRLREVPNRMNAEVLDGIISVITVDVKRRSKSNDSSNFAIRELRRARYLEVDDDASVEYRSIGSGMSCPKWTSRASTATGLSSIFRKPPIADCYWMLRWQLRPSRNCGCWV